MIAFLPAQLPDEASAFGLKAAPAAAPTRISARQLKGTYLEYMSEPGMNPESIVFNQTLIFQDVPGADVRLATEAGANGVFRRVGRGRLAVFGFVPYQGYTLFQFNPNFVQAVLRALWETRGYAALFADNGNLKEWAMEGLSPERAYTLLDARNISHTLPIAGAGASAKLLIPADVEPGFCSIQEDGREKGRFGHNPDTGDSNLEPVKPADLQLAIKEGLSFSQTADVFQGVGRRDLILVCVILLIAAIALEAYAHFLRRN